MNCVSHRCRCDTKYNYPVTKSCFTIILEDFIDKYWVDWLKIDPSHYLNEVNNFRFWIVNDLLIVRKNLITSNS
jgi:hypothetical protein